MKIRNLKYLLVGILFLLGYRFFTYPNFEKVKTELREKYSDFSNGTDEDKLTYNANVLKEKTNGIELPQAELNSAKIYGKFFSADQKLNLSQAKQLTVILNDSSSYRWGEIGTFINYKTIVFYDSEKNIIGITKLDSDLRQTYSTPFTKKMKWGNLSDNGLRKLKEIITE
ncbi:MULTISPECIES: hypothetical protein [Flavobacterium]|uniref:Uncharacterized protein n=1 Tax=Flavobacterium jumunjinense TaxID=998845 RepID=A0ABV5GP69_9FLAO|nr:MULTISPECIES: hypothetical protein [Flavobacterium]